MELGDPAGPALHTQQTSCEEGLPGCPIPQSGPVRWVFFLVPFMKLLVRLTGLLQIPDYLLNLTFFSSAVFTEVAFVYFYR